MAWASLLIFILDSRLMGNLIERLKVLMEDNNGGVPTAVRLYQQNGQKRIAPAFAISKGYA
ncbi:hypothetical protein ACHAP9_003115 [Verticillium nonalfalfae]